MDKLTKIKEQALLEFCLNADKEAIQESLNALESQEEESMVIEKQFAKKMQFLAKASLKKQKNELLLNQVVSKFKNAILNNTEKPLTVLKNLISKGELELQFRKLDSLSEEDIKEIIKDKNLLDLLEKLDNENQEKDKS